jgi:hypothetical protein
VDTLAPITSIGVSGASVFGPTSPIAAYQVAGSMQMVQLISLLNADPPNKLNNVCESQFYWTNPTRFVRNGDIGISSRNLDSEDSFPFFDFEQESKPLRNVGIKYGSTFANLFMLMLFLIVAGLFHSFLFALSKHIPEESESKCSKYTSMVVKFLLNLMTFSFYIRLFLILFMFMALVSIAEFVAMNFSDSAHILSWFIAFGVVVFLFAFFLFSIWLWHKKATDPEKYAETKFDEFFRGLKKNKIHSSYILALTFRKILFSFWIVLFEFAPMGVYVGIITAYQAQHLGGLAIFRPYLSKIDNLVEIVIETVILIILAMLCYYNKQSKWTDSAQTAMLSLIIFMIAFIFLASIGKSTTSY